MAAARNRLTAPAPARAKCKVCGGTGEADGMADCDFCFGLGVEPTIPELRDRLSAAEREAVALREARAPLTNELASKLGSIRAQLRAAEREANGGK